MSKITNLIWAFSGSVLFLYSCSKEVKNTAEHEDSARSGKANSLNIDRKSGAEPSYKKYSGAWFEIDYPAGFSVKNSQKSLTKKEGFDSAIFTSGDDKVQFYVFSPQWSGVPADINLKASEIKTDSTSAVVDGLRINRWTIQAKNGTYFRSYESSSETEGNINMIFGIVYIAEKDLEKYKKEYLHFKNSLEQYAD
ncbi:hypothetical protein L0B70_11555 [Kaistella sp. 97-N-M2]|uniref:hypothetical protein n=1 Tax=Kaistella sp. 97-N-M2 TaxID=2908645 RepID=UPI001F3351F8|nr:hypothetical protein [Kaistella sp. 97-N-M2]UJF29464.1 hypothetical protein L0B70_11555 [Kaistella sp. 97-N-M2]